MRSVELPGRPHNLTVAANGTVVASLQGAGRIALLRDGSVETLDLGGSPHDVKPVGETIVVANEGAARLDLVATDGARQGSVPLRANPHDVAATQDGRIVWATLDGTDEIAEVDLPGRKLIRYLPTGKRPHDLIFTPDGKAWVTDWGGSVHVFSREGELEKTLTLGREAHHIGLTPDGVELWITDHAARSVFVVGAKDLEVKATIPVGGSPHHVAISRDGKWAAVADHDRGLLVIFEVASRKKVDEIRAGAGLHGVWAE